MDASHKPVRETAAEKREREEIKVKGAANANKSTIHFQNTYIVTALKNKMV